MASDGLGWSGHLYLLTRNFCLVQEKADLVIIFPALLHISDMVSTCRFSLQRFIDILYLILNFECRAMMSSIMNLLCVL